MKEKITWVDGDVTFSGSLGNILEQPWSSEMKPLPIKVPKEPTEGEFMSGAEVETIKALVYDWGFEYALKAEKDKVRTLGKRLGADIPE